MACRKTGDHPRLRGEKGHSSTRRAVHRGSPPLTRGKVTPRPRFSGCPGITPAYAGKRGRLLTDLRWRQDHPRLRGEKARINAGYTQQQGSPPLTRGKGTPHIKSRSQKRITPAYAGKSLHLLKFLISFWDHPRLRGEKPYIVCLIFQLQGSPPLTRGKAFRIRRFSKYARITPAYAGKKILNTHIILHGLNS